MSSKINRKPLVYLSHPSSGKLENTLDVEVIIKKMYMNDDIYDKLCIVSPIHCYGFMYHETEYYKGLSFCTDLLMHCDIMLVFGNWRESTGCKEEIELCKKNNIPYIIVGESTELDDNIKNGLLDKILYKINKE